jgi:hypothetical protein
LLLFKADSSFSVFSVSAFAFFSTTDSTDGHGLPISVFPQPISACQDLSVSEFAFELSLGP